MKPRVLKIKNLKYFSFFNKKIKEKKKWEFEVAITFGCGGQ
jgi:hypothetical protein